MDRIEVKTADLIGPALRYAMATACGFKVERIENDKHDTGPNHWRVISEKHVTETRNGLVGYIQPDRTGGCYCYEPDRDWAQLGGLINWCGKHFRLQIDAADNAASFVQGGVRVGYTANSLLVSICRAIVGARLGDVVQVPAELVQGGGAC